MNKFYTDNAHLPLDFNRCKGVRERPFDFYGGGECGGGVGVGRCGK